MDIETRRRKQKDLLVRMMERKVRSRAQALFEARGQEDGHALRDWVQAESEVLENNAVAPLYRRSRTANQTADGASPATVEPRQDFAEAIPGGQTPGLV